MVREFLPWWVPVISSRILQRQRNLGRPRTDRHAEPCSLFTNCDAVCLYQAPPPRGTRRASGTILL